MMRKLWIVLAVVFAASLLPAASIQAAMGTSSKSKFSSKQKAKAAVWMKSRRSMAAGKARGPMYKKQFTKSKAAKFGRGPAWKHYAKGKYSFARSARGPKWHCYRVKRHVRKARAASVARGPAITCPAPVVNVPQQAAPVVNVPQQAAPVVNVPPFPPTVGVTVDSCNIYIVQGDQLMVLDKNTYCLKQSVPLTGATTTGTMGTTGSGIGTGGTLQPSGVYGSGPNLQLPPSGTGEGGAKIAPDTNQMGNDIQIAP